MLQIIGWMLCVYLVVKGFELLAMKSTLSYVGAVIAFAAAPIFLMLINAQSNATASPLAGSYSSSGAEGFDLNSDDVNAETDESIAAADAALNKATADLRAAGSGH